MMFRSVSLLLVNLEFEEEAARRKSRRLFYLVKLLAFNENKEKHESAKSTDRDWGNIVEYHINYRQN